MNLISKGDFMNKLIKSFLLGLMILMITSCGLIHSKKEINSDKNQEINYFKNEKEDFKGEKNSFNIERNAQVEFNLESDILKTNDLNKNIYLISHILKKSNFNNHYIKNTVGILKQENGEQKVSVRSSYSFSIYHKKKNFINKLFGQNTLIANAAIPDPLAFYIVLTKDESHPNLELDIYILKEQVEDFKELYQEIIENMVKEDVISQFKILYEKENYESANVHTINDEKESNYWGLHINDKKETFIHIDQIQWTHPEIYIGNEVKLFLIGEKQIPSQINKVLSSITQVEEYDSKREVFLYDYQDSYAGRYHISIIEPSGRVLEGEFENTSIRFYIEMSENSSKEFLTREEEIYSLINVLLNEYQVNQEEMKEVLKEAKKIVPLYFDDDMKNNEEEVYMTVNGNQKFAIHHLYNKLSISINYIDRQIK